MASRAQICRRRYEQKSWTNLLLVKVDIFCIDELASGLSTLNSSVKSTRSQTSTENVRGISVRDYIISIRYLYDFPQSWSLNIRPADQRINQGTVKIHSSVIREKTCFFRQRIKFEELVHRSEIGKT